MIATVHSCNCVNVCESLYTCSPPSLCSVPSICNLLLETQDYPRKDTAAATSAPTSILLESGGTQNEAGVFVCVLDAQKMCVNGVNVQTVEFQSVKSAT